MPGLIEALQERAAELDAAAIGFLGAENALLLDAGTMPDFRDAAGAELGNLSFSVRELCDAFTEVLEKIESSASPGSASDSPQESIAWDSRVQLTRLAGIADMIDRFRLGEGGENDIFWIEALRGGRRTAEEDRSVRLVITPLDVGPLMREAVFEPLRTAVFTSATLTVAGSFSYWAGRLGLSATDAKEPVFKSFPSPFDYSSHVLLGVPTDAPAPDSPGHRVFLARFLERALVASRGPARALYLLQPAEGDVRRGADRACPGWASAHEAGG